jgi:hypothetical protein
MASGSVLTVRIVAALHVAMAVAGAGFGSMMAYSWLSGAGRNLDRPTGRTSSSSSGRT